MKKRFIEESIQMINKHTKRSQYQCKSKSQWDSTSLTTKTTVIKKQTIISVDVDVGKLGHLYTGM